MTPEETIGPGLAVTALTTFAPVLPGVSWAQRSRARKNGK